jgi:hypothetical protein
VTGLDLVRRAVESHVRVALFRQGCVLPKAVICIDGEDDVVFYPEQGDSESDLLARAVNTRDYLEGYAAVVVTQRGPDGHVVIVPGNGVPIELDIAPSTGWG